MAQFGKDNITVSDIDKDAELVHAWGVPVSSIVVSNMSDDEYLERILGPQRMGYQIVLPMTVIYVIIFLTGVLGNIAVCLVIIKHKSMHTATNYYLFSLAVADLVTLMLGLPNELYLYWQQYPWVLGEGPCRARSLVSEMTGYASVLTILAFSMERYLAICHPLYQYTMAGFSRAVKIITAVWVISFLSALPYAFFTQLNYIDRPLGSGNFLHRSAFCALLDDNIRPKGYPLHQVSSFLFFLVPLIILVYLYSIMSLTINQPHCLGKTFTARLKDCCTPKRMVKHLGSTRPCSGNSHDSHNEEDSDSFQGLKLHSNKRNILILLAAVVVAFFLCWAPFHAQRLIYVYFKHSKFFRTINEYLFHVSGFFYYFNCTLNPILYNVMSLKYRHAFKSTLCGGSPPRQTSIHTPSYTWRSSVSKSRTSGTPRSFSVRSYHIQMNRETGTKIAIQSDNESVC